MEAEYKPNEMDRVNFTDLHFNWGAFWLLGISFDACRHDWGKILDSIEDLCYMRVHV